MISANAEWWSKSSSIRLTHTANDSTRTGFLTHYECVLPLSLLSLVFGSRERCFIPQLSRALTPFLCLPVAWGEEPLKSPVYPDPSQSSATTSLDEGVLKSESLRPRSLCRRQSPLGSKPSPDPREPQTGATPRALMDRSLCLKAKLDCPGPCLPEKGPTALFMAINTLKRMRFDCCQT